VRYKDILTEEEAARIQDLKMDLLDAPNEKARKLIVAEIDKIFATAKRRYYSGNLMMNPNGEEESS
jgi:hypothetical protein